MQRRERHLGRRDGPQVVALDVVGVVGELRQVAGRDHRLGEHERGRPDLLVGVGVAVEARAARSARSSRAPQPRYIVNIDPLILAARSRVEDAELGRRCPSAAPAGGRRRPRGRSPRCAARRCRPRRRRRARRRSAGWGCAAAASRSSAASRSARRRAPSRASPSSRLSAILASASSVVALAPEAADVLRQLLDPGPDLVALGRRGGAARRREPPAASTGGGRARAPRASPARDRVGLGADPADVEHGGRR